MRVGPFHYPLGTGGARRDRCEQRQGSSGTGEHSHQRARDRRSADLGRHVLRRTARTRDMPTKVGAPSVSRSLVRMLAEQTWTADVGGRTLNLHDLARTLVPFALRAECVRLRRLPAWILET